jgi:hypothetical protein
MEKRMKVKYQEIVKFDRDENGNMTYAPFKANGKTFKFIKPGDPIGIAKWSEYQKLQIVVGGGVTFADLIVGLREHKKLLSADQPFSEIRSEAIVWADSTIKGLIDMSQARYDKAFYLASIFIYEDGKDPYAWDMEIAGKMVEDWAIGRVSEEDLFFFAMLQIPAWRQIFQELSERAEREAGRSLAAILLAKMRE